MPQRTRRTRATSTDGAREGAPQASTWPDRWAIPRTFFGAPLCQDLETLNAQVALLGVPFDQGTTNRPGARFGPNGVRDARVYNYVETLYGDPSGRGAAGYFNVETRQVLLEGVTMADCGDVNVAPADIHLAFDRLTRSVQKLLDKGAFPVIVGGDHSITFPAVRGFDRFPSLDIVHFDAHMDFNHDYQDTVLYAHGSPIRRCAELPFVRNITSLGIRSVRKGPYDDAMKRGVQVFTTQEFQRLGPEEVVRRIPESPAMYVTLDIDVLDPMQAPGTGTPAVGGLFYPEVSRALQLLPTRGRIVGFDVVEVAPSYDSSAQMTTRVAAQLIVDFLSVLFPSQPQPTAKARANGRRRSASKG